MNGCLLAFDVSLDAGRADGWPPVGPVENFITREGDKHGRSKAHNNNSNTSPAFLIEQGQGPIGPLHGFQNGLALLNARIGLI